jgi:type I restriction enzyme S subunit
MATKTNLKALIKESKDGEWGKDDPFEDSVEMTVIRGTDFDSVRAGEANVLPIRFIPKRIADRKVLQANDIIFETAGGSKNRPTGRSVFLKSSLFQRADLPITCASFARFIRIEPSKAHPAYIFWYLQYLYEAGHIFQYHTQHTGVARFQYTDFAENFELDLPPLETQRKIASILSAYDDLIENNTRRIKILEEMAQAIYREWFVSFRFPGHEQVKMVDSPIGRVPEGWEVKALGEVAKVNARSIRTANAPETINYIDISSVSTGSIDKVERLPFAEAPSRARRIVQHGDVIWSTVRPNRKSFSLILTPPADLVVSTGFAVISPKSVPYTYLYQALTTDEFVGYLVNHATGAAYPAVNAGDFEKANFLRPAKTLIDAYHKATESVFLLRHRLIAKNQNLRQTRDLLLPKLISGEVEVSELAV